MRTLFLLRGAPGSGKSTWIKNNELEPYTLCADNIRTMMSSPVLNTTGELGISQRMDSKVWALLKETLELRMSNGDMVIIDATHYKRELLNAYKHLIEKYRYRVFVVDFTDISEEECIRRNAGRTGYKVVPEHVIRKMYAVFNSENNQVKSAYHIVSPEAALDMISRFSPIDYSSAEKIYIFGDIHGCIEPIKAFFKENPFSENNKYIFVGDYIDRGIQNKETLEFFIEISKNKNVLCLEGNHEAWLRYYSSKDPKDFEKIRSSEFRDNTLPQIKSIDVSDIRQFCRSLGQLAFFNYHDKTWLVTHGGIPVLPSLKLSTIEYIKGVGKYEDVSQVAEAWKSRYPDFICQVHGHRNLEQIVPNAEDQVINLNSAVEFGEPLRVLELREVCGECKTRILSFENPVHKPAPVMVRQLNDPESNNEIIKSLNNDKHILKQKLEDDIVSYKFSRDVFLSKAWDTMRVKARGLFCRGDEIIARSYEKFFNLKENNTTSLAALSKNLVFPVTAYKKENGFLGLVSWDKEKQKPFISSKSTNKGEHADWFKLLFYSYIFCESVLQYAKENNVTLIFEVIDPKNDPHIIEYDSPKIVFLDIISNDFSETYVPYSDLVKLANSWGMPYKELYKTYENWNSLEKELTKLENEKRLRHEGFVFVDANNFRFKFKTNFYKKWKRFRGIMQGYARNNLKQTFIDQDEVLFVNWLKTKSQDYAANHSIIEVRKQYLHETNSKNAGKKS